MKLENIRRTSVKTVQGGLVPQENFLFLDPRSMSYVELYLHKNGFQTNNESDHEDWAHLWMNYSIDKTRMVSGRIINKVSDQSLCIKTFLTPRPWFPYTQNKNPKWKWIRGTCLFEWKYRRTPITQHGLTRFNKVVGNGRQVVGPFS